MKLPEDQFPVSRTRRLPKPTYYIEALLGEYSQWAFDEERCLQNKGRWRAVCGVPDDHPLDLEIGTGNGFFFAHQAKSYPERCLLGVELKYKPLIQSIRRALSADCKNARIFRYDAGFLPHVLAAGEINNVYIHFPDPWEKKRWKKNRLIQTAFLQDLFALQRPGSFLEFKTDSRDYFDHAMETFVDSPYRLEASSTNLHASELAQQNFVTHFETMFIKQGIPINYALLRRE